MIGNEADDWLRQFAEPVLDEAARLIDEMNEDRPLPQPPAPRTRRNKRTR